MPVASRKYVPLLLKTPGDGCVQRQRCTKLILALCIVVPHSSVAGILNIATLLTVVQIAPVLLHVPDHRGDSNEDEKQDTNGDADANPASSAIILSSSGLSNISGRNPDSHA